MSLQIAVKTVSNQKKEIKIAPAHQRDRLEQHSHLPGQGCLPLRPKDSWGYSG